MSMASLSLVTEEDLKIFYGYGDNYVNAFALSNAWGNFLAYLFSFITVTISMIFYLKKDFLDLKNNYKKLPYYKLKELGYKPLVHEYYLFLNMKGDM